MMAFGHEWQNKEKLKEICSAILSMTESTSWKHLESIAGMLIENHKDRFCGMKTIEEVRENAGMIAGIKKVLAIPLQCSEIVTKDKPITGDK